MLISKLLKHYKSLIIKVCMWLWVISWSLAADETEISLLKTFLNLFTHVCICKSWCSSFMLCCFYKFTPVVCLNPKRSSNALRSEEIREDLGGLNWLCRCAETLVHSSHSVLPTACQTCRNSGKKIYEMWLKTLK